MAVAVEPLLQRERRPRRVCAGGRWARARCRSATGPASRWPVPATPPPCSEATRPRRWRRPGWRSGRHRPAGGRTTFAPAPLCPYPAAAVPGPPQPRLPSWPVPSPAEEEVDQGVQEPQAIPPQAFLGSGHTSILRPGVSSPLSAVDGLGLAPKNSRLPPTRTSQPLRASQNQDLASWPLPKTAGVV
jgi:hypothetical protein